MQRHVIPPHLLTPRTHLRLLRPDEADLILAYYQANRSHLEPWEPIRAVGFYTRDWWRRRLEHSWQEFNQGRSVCLCILTPKEDQVIGTCNFNNIVRGVFQACHLGYSIAARYQGQGLMTEAVGKAIDYMFGPLKLHRIMANYMPENRRSAHLLEGLGFEEEGYARDYLQIAGRWEDHVLMSLINDGSREGLN